MTDQHSNPLDTHGTQGATVQAHRFDLLRDVRIQLHVKPGPHQSLGVCFIPAESGSELERNGSASSFPLRHDHLPRQGL